MGDMHAPDLRSTADLRAEGWTTQSLSDAVRAGSLVRVARGVYSPPPASPLQAHRVRAAALTQVRPGAALSHVSAAAWHGLPVRPSALGTVHLTAGGTLHGRCEAGVHLHQTRLSDADTEVVAGVRVTTLTRTVADLARCEPYAWGVIAADAALARGVAPSSLQQQVDLGRGRHGNALLARVLRFADGRSGSPAESLSRVSLARAGLPAPVLQCPVLDAAHGWVATGDFGWPGVRVIGEVDGRTKYADADRGRSATDVIMAEKRREELIRDCGWQVTRWGWDVAGDHVRLGVHLRHLLG